MDETVGGRVPLGPAEDIKAGLSKMNGSLSQISVHPTVQKDANAVEKMSEDW